MKTEQPKIRSPTKSLYRTKFSKLEGKKMYRPILSEKLIDNIKKTYLPGMRIQLIEMRLNFSIRFLRLLLFGKGLFRCGFFA